MPDVLTKGCKSKKGVFIGLPYLCRSYGVMSNADMRVAEVRQFCELDDEGQTLIKAAMTQLQLSARAYHRILKLSRTIADLAGEEEIKSTHLAKTLQYRPKGMMV
jgi:magnesium chelatase family protein